MSIAVTNIQRARQLLHDLADPQGVLHGWTVRMLTQTFNARYGTAIHPDTLCNYLQYGIAAGWFTIRRDSSHLAYLTWTLAPDEQARRVGGGT